MLITITKLILYAILIFAGIDSLREDMRTFGWRK